MLIQNFTLSFSSSRIQIDKCDPRDLDPVLAELTLLSARNELYYRFIMRRIRNDLDIGIVDEPKRKSKLSQLESLLASNTGITRAIQELLCHYITLERYFLSESVSKAVAMDTIVDESALTSSIVDDVFFLVKKSIRLVYYCKYLIHRFNIFLQIPGEV